MVWLLQLGHCRWSSPTWKRLLTTSNGTAGIQLITPATPPAARLANTRRLSVNCPSVLLYTTYYIHFISGAARLGRRPTGIAHSKITRVRVLSWPLPVLTSLYFLTVTKSGDESLVFVVREVVSNQFKAIKKISVFSANNGKKYFIPVFYIDK